jgi:hypothetical protein
MRLKRVSVMGVATWHALYSFIFAIFLGIVYSTFAYLRAGNLQPTTFLYYMLAIPLIYSPLGFIAYALVAFIYNSLANNTRGIILELDHDHHDPPPPPPPTTPSN